MPVNERLDGPVGVGLLRKAMQNAGCGKKTTRFELPANPFSAATHFMCTVGPLPPLAPEALLGSKREIALEGGCLNASAGNRTRGWPNQLRC